MNFPFVTGTAQDGRRFDLPDWFGEGPTLVVVGFGDRRRSAVASWLAVAEDVDDAELSCYELPVRSREDGDGRLAADGGRPGPEAGTEVPTVTVRTDERGFRAALGLDGDEDGPHALLLDGDEVVWRSSGPATDERADVLRDRVAELAA